LGQGPRKKVLARSTPQYMGGIANCPNVLVQGVGGVDRKDETGKNIRSGTKGRLEGVISLGGKKGAGESIRNKDSTNTKQGKGGKDSGGVGVATPP